ncbi:MAG: 6-phosphogluconolactonase [Proteobacteria bacterium]|nr:6-phosphogluconolactonase [Pseudomonadota bacterium]MBU1139163.1 6-phosphogluconolactonase [Pseudomonadota bacterium]
MMKGIQFYEFPDTSSLVEELTGQIGQALEEGIAVRGQASLAVSGGNTPLPLFDALSKVALEWKKVLITLVDERWVAVEEMDSNEKMVREHLLKGRAAEAGFLGMKTSDASAKAGEGDCAMALSPITLPFDVLILGMGNDGHTASLFPGAVRLKEAVAMDSGKLCMAISPPKAPHERMSLTLPAILNSRQIILHISGATKRDVYEKACDHGPAEKMPIRYILNQSQTPVTVYWAP